MVTPPASNKSKLLLISNINYLISYFSPYFSTKALVLELDKHMQKALSKKLKRLLMQIQRNVFVVISDDDNIITVAHQH